MIIHRAYRRKEKRRPPSTRDYTILQPGTWQQVFAEKIWETTKKYRAVLILNELN